MSIVRHTRHKLSDFYTYWRLFRRNPNVGKYTVSIAEDGTADLLEAKKLHAKEYLSRNFIEHTDILNEIIHEESDPHQKHAVYFVVKNRQKVVGVARQIIYKGSGPMHESFPVLDKAKISQRSRTKIERQHPHKIVEISALVKARSESSIVPIVLYRSMWQYSRQNNHDFWVMACDVRLYQRLKILFGPAIVKIGNRTSYKGGDVIPAALHIPSSHKYLRSITTKRSALFSVRYRAAAHMLRKDRV